MNTISPSETPSTSSGLSILWPLRVFMGLTFLYAGLQHLTDPSYFDPTKPGYIGGLISQYAMRSPIHVFLVGVVEPNAMTFGYLIGVGELLIGIATLFGFLYRIAVLCGLLLSFTFFLSATWNVFPFYFGSDIVFVMCWLTLLLAGPQSRQSLDGILASRYHSLGWLTANPFQKSIKTTPSQIAHTSKVQVPLLEQVRLYPKQVLEVNRAFDRIKEQFTSHEETQTILEFARAFVISLGVDRHDSQKILSMIQNIVRRDPWEQNLSGQV